MGKSSRWHFFKLSELGKLVTERGKGFAEDELKIKIVFFLFLVSFLSYMTKYVYYCKYIFQGMVKWNNKVKRLLKSELIKRGVSNADLSLLLKEIGIHETKASIDSKISRGSFSASFFIQCLSVIGCNKIEIEEYENTLTIAAEPTVEYKRTTNEK